MDISQTITALTGLAGILLSFYTIKKNSDIKLKEQNNDHKHQLTKEKYQQLMSDKINLYNIIYEIYKFHNQNKLNIGFPTLEVDEVNRTTTEREYEEYEVYLETYYKIDVSLKNTTFLLSNELEEYFMKIKLQKEKLNLLFNYEFREGMIENFEKENKDTEKLFVEKTKNDFDSFFSSLEKEIKQIRINLKLKI